MAYEIGQTCMLINIGLSRSECASWVQAWGAIIAIAVGAIAVVYQLHTSRKHAIDAERRQLQRRINAAAAVAMNAEAAVAHAAKVIGDYCRDGGQDFYPGALVPGRLLVAQEELQWLREAEWNSFYVVRALRQLALCVEVVKELHALLARPEGPMTAKISPMADEADDALNAARAALAELERATDEIDDDPLIVVPPMDWRRKQPHAASFP
jgi:hypothetical protein